MWVSQKAEGLVKAQPKAPQRWVWLGLRAQIWQTTAHAANPNHHQTLDMVKKAISQMKAAKALDPSGTVVEMIRAAGDSGASMICDLAAAIIHDGKVPSDWEQSFIVCLYKGKRGALDRGKLPDKLTEQIMKVLERIVDGLIRQFVSIDYFQFGFVPSRGTADAIFLARQLQEE